MLKHIVYLIKATEIDIMDKVMTPNLAARTDDTSRLIKTTNGHVQRTLIEELSKSRDEYVSSRHLIDVVGAPERSVTRALLTLYSRGILSRRRRNLDGYSRFEYCLAV